MQVKKPWHADYSPKMIKSVGISMVLLTRDHPSPFLADLFLQTGGYLLRLKSSKVGLLRAEWRKVLPPGWFFGDAPLIPRYALNSSAKNEEQSKQPCCCGASLEQRVRRGQRRSSDLFIPPAAYCLVLISGSK